MALQSYWDFFVFGKFKVRVALLRHAFNGRLKTLNTSNPSDVSPQLLSQYLQASTGSLIDRAKRAHVDASKLQQQHPPSSLRDHNTMCATDKILWDRAYLHEYLGLHEDAQAWDYITEDEYKTLRPVAGNALPSMAIATIKKDENGTPKRAKYRIVALGNLDPHLWSKNDCFAPVMSHLQLRILLASAVQLQRHPKAGDFIQAFCQSRPSFANHRILGQAEDVLRFPPLLIFLIFCFSVSLC